MRMFKTLLSVILPTFNEAGNIVPLIEKIKLQLKIYSYEILVVDDDSPDKTADLVNNRFFKEKNIKLFRRKKDKGLAKSIYFGIKKSCGEYILVMDTDFNHNPKDIPRFLLLKNNFDMVIGSRYIKGGGMENRLRCFLSSIYNLLIRNILNLKIHDNLSGFFIIKKVSLNILPLKQIFAGYGEYFIRLLFYAHKNNLKIKEVPVYYKNRQFGKSKSKFLSMFFDYSKTVLALYLDR